MKKFFVIMLTFIALVLFGCGGYVGLKLYEKYSEGTTWADLRDYYDLESSELGAVMLDGVILDEAKTENLWLTGCYSLQPLMLGCHLKEFIDLVIQK